MDYYPKGDLLCEKTQGIIDLVIDPKKLHLFDPDSGARMNVSKKGESRP